MEMHEDPHKKPDCAARKRELHLTVKCRGHVLGFQFLSPNPWDATYMCVKCGRPWLSLPAAVPVVCPYGEV